METSSSTKYQEYLLSPEWKTIKKKIITRAKGCCEGCGEAKPLEVHHLTYDRIGQELLTDLAAYCSECHGKAHEKSEPSDWNKYLTNKTDVKPKARLKQDIELEKIINSI